MAGDGELIEVHARAFDATSDLAAVASPSESRLLDVNESFLRITGYDRDELIEGEVEESELWVDPGQRERILAELDQGRTVTGMKIELRAKDGTVRHLRGSAELVQTGGDLHVFAIAEDRSEDLARRDELSHARRAVRALTEERRRRGVRLDLAVREEQARISHALHDSTLQDLFAAKLRLHMVEEALGTPGRVDLEQLQEAIEAAIASTETLISELRRPVPERTNLAGALDLALHEIATRAGVTHEVRDRLSQSPPVDVATIAHEMVREVLSLVELHARASRVEIDLEERDGGLLITIVDDGPGGDRPYAPESTEWRLTGLEPIRERLAVIGGRLHVARSLAQGTTVELWIPIDASPGIGESPV
jgi:PAS domain S-box-containing protein